MLLKRYQREFTERALALLKTRDEAEDVVQEAFVRIYRFADRFTPEAGGFKPWAMTILMNVARSAYRKRAIMWLRHAPLHAEHYENLAAPSHTEAAFAQDVVERALAQIPEDTALLLRKAFIEGFSYAELGALLGISEGAVKVRVLRGKRALRQVIQSL